MGKNGSVQTECVAVMATGLIAGLASGQIDGISVTERVFNDFADTTLLVTNTNSVQGGTVSISETEYTGAGFANRHDVLMSSDGGATANLFSINDSFVMSAEITLDTGSGSPRKEAGIRINSGTTGDALFLINSDAGEIVAFGGGAPFQLFGSNGNGNGYTLGDTITMGISFTGATAMSNATIEYFIDRGNGIESSGPLDWSNLEGGPVDFSVGFYGQFSPSGPDDFVDLTFSNIQFVPTPSAAMMLGVAGLVGMRRRR